jgi:hypothetical protein
MFEKARQEWARDDGVVLVNGNVNDGIKADDRTFDFAGWAKLLEEDKAELDNYGPNQALIGDMANHVRPRHSVATAGRHGRAWAVYPRLSRLEGAGLSRDLLRCAAVLAGRALYPRDG